MGESWRTVLEAEFTNPYLRKLKDFFISEVKSHEVYPPYAFIQYGTEDIYTWSRLTPLARIGQARPSYFAFHSSNSPLIPRQDPYHDVGQAHGLSFSVLPPTKLSGSLKNIYKQLASDIPPFSPPKTGDFTPLAKADKGWESFTDAVLNAVLDRANDTGRGDSRVPAKNTCERLQIDEKHLVLRSAHPSPLSAHRVS
ncbi:uracil-DNA glycosylase [Boletus edulis]|nr:uracil-DNA glycosylase [Boletus edulis]